ncbi:hypothetical protein CYLTODRAFT_338581, partial [Cylindrobasidium torrendii FP15055 ss-10]
MDARVSSIAAVSAIVIFGTLYSVAYDTYMDTSNPFISHLPHHLASTTYFASKSNWLNVYFIKYSWGWTTAAFFLLWSTSPPSARTTSRLAKWAVETAIWVAFTSWFFGPALVERFVVASGADCYLNLPSGELLTVPHEFCFNKAAIRPAEHPELFEAASLTTSFPDMWRARPRFRKGHDISGHIFLLTMSTLFLVDQLRATLNRRGGTVSARHTYAIWANVGLVLLWMFAICTTSLYFHTAFEKFSGLLVGLAAFGVSQIPSLLSTPTPTR